MDRYCDKKSECHSGCGTDFREAVCIHTDKIYDSCRDKYYTSYISIGKIKKGAQCPFLHNNNNRFKTNLKPKSNYFFN